VTPLFDGPEMREQDRLTAEAFADPQPGMEFHEMWSFWCIVLAVEPDGGKVTTLAVVGPGKLPDIGRVETFDTADDFRRMYAYGSIPGYSMALRSGPIRLDVTGWLDHYPREKWVDKSAYLRERDNPKPKTVVCGSCGQVRP